MTGIIFSPTAQTDIDKIWDYTATSWNVDQAERYIQDIRDACHELAEGRRMSRPLDIRKGYRKVPVGSHFLYFKSNDAGQIIIVRILHQRMDVAKHL
ncbi:type II toxin-antitoxin system RelE/ParE family toxin [Rhizobium leguminosarum]|uniref:type II toxin-antitoxin system RelE/ParE family toxin n=1 Tax=Rhizobium leguminosarum TaxID=384 RepID=UPI001441C929|nr:type II toxin-antitoxin system RelE/ParE family toxin [Rhizobium leguminosarum]MBY5818966.1 type II toxin-antitoxin system RelE/ParE family toxin [Rhizobium leguminosarum]NKL03019.1 type II toxin-antitoxin system RelE/ParE family toxin [Rhizobium leguminosarum bv. viciae]NKL79892.1 type II toxin-antitoxin system RelE/ParE family toxin [Rhizobium leguminosarum bv. viciae]